jgi:hypothetical protein
MNVTFRVRVPLLSAAYPPGPLARHSDDHERGRRAHDTPVSLEISLLTSAFDALMAARVAELCYPGLTWARRLGSRRPTPFALLEHMGADCADAVQILPPGRHG